MLRPTGSYTWNNPSYVGYEFTPLYGSPAFDGKWPQRFTYGPQIGGGNALSYTFGQEMIGLIPGSDKEQTLLTMFQDDGYLPSLSVASGISSSAFAGATSYLSGLFPWKDVLQYFIDYFFSAEANSNEPMLDTADLEGELKDKKADMDQLVGLLDQNKESVSSILKLLLKIIVEGGGELIDGMTPKSNYFSPVDQNLMPGNTLFNFGDGGLSDNFGLISLLRRGVKKVVVFINTSDPFEVIEDAGKEEIKIDITVPSFFGIVTEKPNPIGGQHFDDMKVFNTDEYAKQLLPQFKSAFQSKEAIVAETQLEVLPNKAWDLEGGYTVDVLWYYNSLPEEFSQQAGEEVMRTLIPNKADEGKGGSFPLYGTLSSTLGGLKPFEINMMGNIGYWILQNTDDRLKKFFS